MFIQTEDLVKAYKERNAVNGVSYTDSTAQAGVSYTYTVRGRAASGAMSPSYDRTGVSSGIPADVTLAAARAGTDCGHRHRPC